MEVIYFKCKKYPKFQSIGNAAQFAIPYAKHVCIGKGLDIGYGKEEWKFPGAQGIDLVDNNEYHALNLPSGKFDYIFSSHLLEHLPNWVEALDYWISKIRNKGSLFLYLPAYSQEYWRPWNNKKHIHILDPRILSDYLTDRGLSNIFISERDLNDSFMVCAEK